MRPADLSRKKQTAKLYCYWSLCQLTSVFTSRRLETSICEEKNKELSPKCIISAAVTMRLLEPTLECFEASKEFTDQLKMGFYTSEIKYSQKYLMSWCSSKLESINHFWKSFPRDSQELLTRSFWHDLILIKISIYKLISMKFDSITIY